MKILVTTHHFLRYTGTETYTLTLLDYLIRNKHEVYFYSKYIGPISQELTRLKIYSHTDNLLNFQDIKFDIAHVHHNVNASEVRYIFPTLPIVFQSHGVLPFLEQPPQINLGISRFLAISEEVQHNLIDKGVSPDKVEIFRNIFDTQQFYTINPLNYTPQSALIFSNYNNEGKESAIMEACTSLGISYELVGGKYGQVPQSQLNDLLNRFDLVFTLGRGIVETILAGRIPFVISPKGMDGIVTSNNYKEIIKHNFSGRRYNKPYSSQIIANEIKKEFKPDDLPKLQDEISKLFGAQPNIKRLIKIYKTAAKDKLQNQLNPLNDYFMSSLETERFYSSPNMNVKLTQLIDEYNRIKESALYRLWGKYEFLKKLLSLSKQK